MSKAVDNQVIKYLSPSAISAFNPLESGCNRRWYARYVLGESFQPNASALLGTKIHSEIEHYLTIGELALGDFALSALEFLPEPKSVQTEQKIKGLLLAGVPIEGIIDVLNTSRVFINSQGIKQELSYYDIEILDWKTTSNIAYVKVGKQLLTTQMIIYALWVAKFFPEKQNFFLSHCYISTRGKKQTIKNFIKITLDELNSYVPKLVSLVEQIKQVVTLENINQVTPNWDSCNAFSGCPYRHHCNKQEETKMGLLDLLVSTQNGTPQPTPKTLSNLADLKATILAEEQQVLASLPNIKIYGICEACKEQVDSNNGSQTPTGKIKHLMGCKAAVLPVDANRTETPKLAPTEEKTVVGAPAETPLAQEATSLQETPKKRGRPTGSKNISDLGSTPVVETAQETVTAKQKGFTLYVNCLLVGMLQNDIGAKVTQIAQRLADQANCFDIRCSKNEMFSFGAWKGALASTIQEEFKNYQLEHLSISNVENSDFKQIAVEVLESMALVVVRGI